MAYFLIYLANSHNILLILRLGVIKIIYRMGEQYVKRPNNLPIAYYTTTNLSLRNFWPRFHIVVLGMTFIFFVFFETFRDVSRHFETFWDNSRLFETFRDISRHFDLSRHFETFRDISIFFRSFQSRSDFRFLPNF